MWGEALAVEILGASVLVHVAEGCMTYVLIKTVTPRRQPVQLRVTHRRHGPQVLSQKYSVRGFAVLRWAGPLADGHGFVADTLMPPCVTPSTRMRCARLVMPKA